LDATKEIGRLSLPTGSRIVIDRKESSDRHAVRAMIPANAGRHTA
jgi:hypothetical protein